MPRNIAVVLFEGAEELDFAGPWEIFAMLSRVRPDSCTVYTVAEHGGELHAAKGLRVIPDYSFADAPEADVIIIPGGQGTRAVATNPAFVEWVRKAARRAEVVASVCTGAFVLHAAGLLEGKRATTHWRSLKALRDLGVNVVEERYVDEGHIVTASGVSAGIDVSLYLVGRLWDPPTARVVQKGVEYFPEPPYAHVPLPEGL